MAAMKATRKETEKVAMKELQLAVQRVDTKDIDMELMKAYQLATK